MDVFSFGMLCLWVLFEKYLSRTTPFPQVASWANELLTQTSNSYPSEFILDNLKHQDKLGLLAHKLLDAEVTINTERKNALSQFLTSALSYDSNKREASLQKLVDVLMPHRYDLPDPSLST